MSHKRVYARLRRAMAISGSAFPQNIELTAAVADLIYIMDKGRMVSSLLPTELMANERMLETYLGIAAR
jgi:ABC-type branched-subunit amino acid transport system ATPase component